MGSGGKWAFPRSNSVSGHQISRATTITVVICMILSAFPLDSWIPLVLLHQKYPVTTTPKTAAKEFGSRGRIDAAVREISLRRRPRYWPALTTLMGPVRM